MSTTRRSFLYRTAFAGAMMGMAPLFGPGCASPGGGKAKKKLDLLILGGTGFIGPHMVEHAVSRGHTVTLFNRGFTNTHLFPDLEKLRGNRDPEKDDGLTALVGRRWDAVIDNCSYVPRITKASMDVLAENVGHYVLISSISAYASFEENGITEDAPVARIEDETVEEITGETYGALKVLCEEAAEAAMPGRVANVRPGYIVGPRDSSDRFTYWPLRIERGGEVLAPGTASDPIQVIDARDLAAWCVHLIEERIAGPFSACGPREPLPMGEMLETCRRATGSDATFTWVDAEFLETNGVHAGYHLPIWLPPTGEYRGMGTVSNARAVAAGLRFRPLEETVVDLLAWIHGLEDAEERLANPRAGLPPEREAEVLAAWHTARG